MNEARIRQLAVELGKARRAREEREAPPPPPLPFSLELLASGDSFNARAHWGAPRARESFRSFRATSNSRGPGQEGNVYAVRVGLTRCLKCGAQRLDLGGPHAPRHLGDQVVDCVGDPA